MVQATGERRSAALQEATRSPQPPCDLEVADGVTPAEPAVASTVRARSAAGPGPRAARRRAAIPVAARVPGMRRRSGNGAIWHLLPDQAWLDLDDKTYRVGLTALAQGRPDPFARFEPGLPAHLESAHADVVAALVRLADARVGEGAARVRPLMLNRYGLALRIEYARGHRDIHVPFPDPVDTGQGLTYAMRALVAEATQGSEGRGRFARGCRR